VRVQPSYPAPAQARGIEGWVDVRFDVTTNGLVVNVPQVATGIEYRFRFDMNDS
jgi:TonB family protein